MYKGFHLSNRTPMSSTPGPISRVRDIRLTKPAQHPIAISHILAPSSLYRLRSLKRIIFPDPSLTIPTSTSQISSTSS